MCGFIYFGKNLQESNSLVMRESVYFHDMGLYIVLGVAFLVGMLLIVSWVAGFTSSTYLENKWLEMGWTILPTFILMVLALPSLRLLFYMEAPTSMSPGASVKIMGHQWYWTLNYSLNGTSVKHDMYMLPNNSLEGGDFRSLEVDVPLPIYLYEYTRFVATAADVLHSFALPSLGMKLDSVPGRMNQQCVFPDNMGMFYGQCSEICGANHSFMPISVEVCSPF